MDILFKSKVGKAEFEAFKGECRETIFALCQANDRQDKEIASLKRKVTELEKKVKEAPKKTISDLVSEEAEKAESVTYNKVMDEWLNGEDESDGK